MFPGVDRRGVNLAMRQRDALREGSWWEGHRLPGQRQRHQPGARQQPLRRLQSADDPSHVTIVKMLESAASVDDHRMTEHYARAVALLDDIMTEPRNKDIHRLVMSDLLEPVR